MKINFLVVLAIGRKIQYFDLKRHFFKGKKWENFIYVSEYSAVWWGFGCLGLSCHPHHSPGLRLHCSRPWLQSRVSSQLWWILWSNSAWRGEYDGEVSSQIQSGVCSTILIKLQGLFINDELPIFFLLKISRVTEKLWINLYF